MDAVLMPEPFGLGGVSAEAVMEWHLTHNHFPPLPVELVPACLAAVEACNEGDYERMIATPEGFYTLPAREIVEACNLGDSVEWPDE